MLPERKSCVGSHPCQSCRRTSCNGRGWVLLSTDSLKFRKLEIDWANGEDYRNLLVSPERKSMPQKRKLQVFVSSTYTDLREERQAAVEAILTAGHIPAGMELFTAGDESQMQAIKRWIDESDVFLLILGGRYGSIEPSSQKSYIHLEYEYAIEQKKPYFAIVI